MTFPETRTIEALLNLPGLSGQTIDLAHKYLDGVQEWNSAPTIDTTFFHHTKSGSDFLLPDRSDDSGTAKTRSEAETLCSDLNNAVQAHWTQLMEVKAV